MEQQLYDITNNLEFYCNISNLKYQLKITDANGETKYESSSDNRDNRREKSQENKNEGMTDPYVNPQVLKPLSVQGGKERPEDSELSAHVNVFKTITHKSSECTLDLLDKKEIDGYLYDGFEEIQQITCRELAKAWMKLVEPKKQSRFPYKYGERTKPYWWPDVVRHKEPDHLVKEERVHLLISMLKLFGTKNDGNLLTLSIKVIRKSYEEYKSNDFNERDFTINRRIMVIEEMFKVVKYIQNPINLLTNSKLSVLRLGKLSLSSDDSSSTRSSGARVKSKLMKQASVERSEEGDGDHHKHPFSGEEKLGIVIDSGSRIGKIPNYSSVLTPQGAHSMNLSQYVTFPMTSTPSVKLHHPHHLSVARDKEGDKENQSGEVDYPCFPGHHHHHQQQHPPPIPMFSISPTTPTRPSSKRSMTKTYGLTSPFFHSLDSQRQVQQQQQIPSNSAILQHYHHNLAGGEMESTSLAQRDEGKKRLKVGNGNSDGAGKIEISDDDDDDDPVWVDSDATVSYTGSP